MKAPSGYALIRRHLRRYPRSLRQSLMQELVHLITYEPVIGIMGKTGVGKSSLCNALFRSEVCAVSAVDACTRAPQRIRLRFGDHYLTLVDLPGVGENQLRDEEYRTLYQSLLPELDLVLWVLKADDRAFSTEERFYQDIFNQVSAEGPPIIWLLNQVDKTEPSEQWNWKSSQPSAIQAENIISKRLAVARNLDIMEHDVFPVSVKGRYQLGKIVEAMITRLPKEARSPLLPHLQNGYRTSGAVNIARNSFGDAVVEIVEKVIDIAPLPQAARSALLALTHTIARAAKSVWSFFFD